MKLNFLQKQEQNIIYVFILILATYSSVNAQKPGSLDLSFGQNGQVFDVGDGNDFHKAFTDLLINPDGSIVACGYHDDTYEFSSSLTVRYPVLWIKKFNVNGEADATFIETKYNYCGQSDLFFGSAHFLYNASKILGQPDGKFLTVGEILGQSSGYAGYSYVGVTKHNPNGSLDTTFSPGGNTSVSGTFITNPGFQELGIDHSCKVLGGTIDANNSIYVHGQVKSFGDDYWKSYILKITTDGLLDTTFNENGILIFDPFEVAGYSINSQSTIMQLKLTPEGKIVALGVMCFDQWNSNIDFNSGAYYLLSLNEDGTINENFSDDGIFYNEETIDIGAYYVCGFTELHPAFEIDENGDIVIVSTNEAFFKIQKLNSNGNPVASFGNPTNPGHKMLLELNDIELDHVINYFQKTNDNQYYIGICDLSSETSKIYRFNEDFEMDYSFVYDEPGIFINAKANSNNQIVLVGGNDITDGVSIDYDYLIEFQNAFINRLQANTCVFTPVYALNDVVVGSIGSNSQIEVNPTNGLSFIWQKDLFRHPNSYADYGCISASEATTIFGNMWWNSTSNNNTLSFTGTASLDSTYYRCIVETDVCRGLSDTVLFIIGEPTGLIQSDLVAKANVYPNPSNTNIQVTFTNSQSTDFPLQYSVINNLGAIVQTGTLQSNTETINIEKLARGIYTIHLTNNRSARFIKQ